jgi:catechol 2,3-dioxygenase-like lactoylglutathione lyase family enzyme
VFSGGYATIYVSDMDASVRFYTETLGMKLEYRFGNHWALVHAGKGLSIGIHPASEERPAGRKGSIHLGLELNGSIDDAVRELESRGVRFSGPVIRDKAGNFVSFCDPDGNVIYLAEMNVAHVSQGEGEYTHA